MEVFYIKEHHPFSNSLKIQAAYTAVKFFSPQLQNSYDFKMKLTYKYCFPY